MSTVPATSFPGRRGWLALAGGLALLFLCLLGTRGLNEPDEGRYANIAMAMARPGGDWWEPRMSGYGHYDKPPFVYWATALSFRVFGLNEWAARLPSFAGAALALGGLGWAAYRLHGARVAWWATLICGTSAQFWAFGRILSPDMLLTGWCTLAVAAWAEAKHRGGSWGWWSISLGGWTLAWWTKATPALVPLAGLIAGLVVTRDTTGRRALRPALLLPAILVLGSPWYLSMLGHYPELHDFFFGRELKGRLVGRVDGRHGWPGYYVPISLVAWLPWWPVVAWTTWRARARLFTGRPAPALITAWTRRIGVEGWIVLTGLLILSLVSSKLSSYTLTLAPWAALLMARALASASVSPEGRFRPICLWPAGIFALAAIPAIAVWPGRWEARLGVNSSLRQVSEYLQRQGTGRVDSDRYWAGLEFYLSEEVIHYVIRIDGLPPTDDPDSPKAPPAAKVERYHERDSDGGAPPNRFVNPDEWPALPPDAVLRPGSWWFIRFHRLDKPVFDRTLQNDDPARRPVKVTRIGDFDLYRMPDPR